MLFVPKYIRFLLSHSSGLSLYKDNVSEGKEVKTSCVMEWRFCGRMHKPMEHKEEYKNIRSLPLIVTSGIWIGRNSICFEETFVLPIKCVFQSLGIINYFL